ALAAPRIAKSVEPGVQGCYVGGVEQFRYVANYRATRYLASCHRSTNSCGHAPGGCNLAGATFSLICRVIIAGASDGHAPGGPLLPSTPWKPDGPTCACRPCAG